MGKSENASHHKRKKHPRQKKDFTYTMVRDAIVRNRGKSASALPARNLDLANLEALASDQTDTVDYDSVDADDVVFAMEYPEWSSQGFKRASAEPWVENGFDPQEARSWRETGATAHYAARWLSIPRYSVKEKIPFETAKIFLDNNVTSPEMAGDWLTAGIRAEEAVRWINSGNSLREAIAWKREGIDSPQEKEEWEQLGFRDPKEVTAVQRMGDEAALRWFNAGATFTQGAALNQIINDSYSEKDIMRMISWPDMTTYFMREWITAKIPVDQIRQFIEKGYTPKQAAIQLRAGRTSSTVKDRRNGQLVPGKAWLEIKAKFDELKKNGEQVTLQSQRGTNGHVSAKFEIGPPGKNTNKIFNFRFMYTGAFVSANSNVTKKTRTVSTKAAFFRLHFPE